jgi:anti-sigma B factor antagonist
MNIRCNGHTVSVDGIKELDAANATAFRDAIYATLNTNGFRDIEVDLSQTVFLDSWGLGVLVALRKAAESRNGSVRLLNPTPPVQQILELTRLHRLFDLVHKADAIPK